MNEHLEHIESVTLNVLQGMKLGGPPVPVDKVAEKFGLEVVPFDFPDTLSGVLKREKKIIGVNKKHHRVRQRFTVAHELGHFLLGHDQNDFIDDRFDRPIPQEKEANLFASLLLMPKEWVLKSTKSNGLDIKQLSREYDVSEQSMSIRLLGLNLIK